MSLHKPFAGIQANRSKPEGFNRFIIHVDYVEPTVQVTHTGIGVTLDLTESELQQLNENPELFFESAKNKLDNRHSVQFGVNAAPIDSAVLGGKNAH